MEFVAAPIPATLYRHFQSRWVVDNNFCFQVYRLWNLTLRIRPSKIAQASWLSSNGEISRTPPSFSRDIPFACDKFPPDTVSLRALPSTPRFLWCSGYHIRLTRGRSQVRALAGTAFLIFERHKRPYRELNCASMVCQK